MTRISRLHISFIRALALAAMAFASLPAQAQYQWKDANGSMVFSDRPPPPGSAVRIVKAPLTPPVVVPADKAAAPAAAPTAKVAAMAGSDRQLNEKMKQAEKADKAKASAESEQAAKDTARQCENLRENMRGLQTGERISRVNKAGEREFLSEADRNAKMQENTRDLAKHCK